MLKYITLLLFATVADADPRHFFDPRCPAAASLDVPGSSRVCSSCVYDTLTLTLNATVMDCVTACCGDWSCLSFVFIPPSSVPTESLNGSWINHDSLRGDSGVIMSQLGTTITAVSTDPAKAYWTSATGVVTDLSHLWLCFDCESGDTKNNRSGTLSDGNATITLERLPFDPANFSQVG